MNEYKWIFILLREGVDGHYGVTDSLDKALEWNKQMYDHYYVQTLLNWEYSLPQPFNYNTKAT